MKPLAFALWTLVVAAASGCGDNLAPVAPTACGNGVLEAGEACDDGNLESGDGCDRSCTPSGCGNGIATAGEECDDGNATDGDGCDTSCTMTACGNGIQTAGEACDDGNLVNEDGCDRNCIPTGCGNGVPTAGEACDDGNATNGDDCDVNCTLPACGNGVHAPDEACDDGNAIDGDGCDRTCTVTGCGNGIPTAGEVCDDGNLANGDGCDNDCTVSLLAYVKASNTDADDYFGRGVALSADGSTLAVSAWQERSAATGVGGDEADDSTFGAGAVYVFVRSGVAWVQQAYLKASNTGALDRFGASLALSADGAILAVGAIGEDSGAIGVGGNQASNTTEQSGAVYVFARTGAAWSQQAYVKASNTGVGDGFGWAVALSGDGATLAVGAPFEDSFSTGVGGNQTNNTAQDAGAVYVLVRAGAAWSQQAYVKASNTGAGDEFGGAVALSADGSTLAVGARGEDSAATGVGGNQTGNTAASSGAVYVLARAGTTWSQQAYVKASNTGAGDEFGGAVALSGDGATLAVGAIGEASGATGVDGDQGGDDAVASGAVYVLARSGAVWSQQAYVKASNTGVFDNLGGSLALSGDGSFLAVGAAGEGSAATGVGGDPLDDTAPRAGAVYALARTGATWSHAAYVKAPNAGGDEYFGRSVALSGDGLTLAVGADGEDSAATGIGGDQADDTAPFAGAVYVSY